MPILTHEINIDFMRNDINLFEYENPNNNTICGLCWPITYIISRLNASE